MGEINKQQSPQNSRIIVEKDKKGRFVKGHKKIGGRQIGTNNFSTLFDEAIRKIVTEQKINISNPEVEMVTKAIIEALKGNFVFYRDLMDRKYGQATKSIDITTGGESFFRPTEEEKERVNKALKEIE